MDETKRWRVEPAEAGQRLDVHLAGRLSLSRAQVRRLLGRGAVRVEGRAQAEGAKGEAVPAGVAIEVDPFRPPADQRAVAEAGEPLAVLAQGADWLVIDKPAGVPVHPLEEAETGTVLHRVIARHPEIHGVGEGGLRSGVVHRLDVDTSGALLMATGEERWRGLREEFQAHRVAKRYRALVKGRWKLGERRVRVGLVVARHRPARVRVIEEAEIDAQRSARLGVLTARALERFADASLVEVDLETGFLHQVRATLAHLGHPVLGDAVYGAGPSDAAPRQMLHAERIEIGAVSARSEDPPDFAACLAALGPAAER